MACLREGPVEGRSGIVQCDEEGCESRCIKVGEGSNAFVHSPSGECVLKLRPRAGDSEKAWDDVIHEWDENWKGRPLNKDIEEHFGDFWDERRNHLKEHYDRGELVCRCEMERPL